MHGAAYLPRGPGSAGDQRLTSQQGPLVILHLIPRFKKVEYLPGVRVQFSRIQIDIRKRHNNLCGL